MAGIAKVKKGTDEMKAKLVNLLKTVFQFEDQDLDFGIYRIMNQKREDIQYFIEKELIEKIVEQLKLVGEEQREEVVQELEDLKNEVIKAYGKDAFKNGELKDEFKKYELGREYSEKLKQLESIEISKDLEREIYNHIYSFFSRYYDKGDFLSQRRYTRQGNERYAIPYDGEEVLLYWANTQQYYIKSTLNFQKYAFKSNNSLNVNFRIVTAEEEKGNVKPNENKYFVIFEKKSYEFEGSTLNIYFEYRPLTDAEKDKRKFGKKTQISQNDVNEHNYEFLKKKLDKEQKAQGLFKAENGKTVLEKNLYKYTTSNKADYFIHKDLDSFLKRELDFYLKNEVLKLEDLKSDDIQRNLLKTKVIRNISEKIIELLNQIEKYQKKLWEKKKFVISTDYIISLNKIVEYAGKEVYDKIIKTVLQNNEQLKEWKDLFALKILNNKEFLKKFKMDNEELLKLAIDTGFFDEEFKLNLLENLTKERNLNDILNGILIKSDNWHAINLLKNSYVEKVKCIYIDPPYNTKSKEFLYKDGFKNSSWLCMMENRVKESYELLKNDGIFISHIDENECENLTTLLKQKFGDYNYLGTVIWDKRNPKGDAKQIAYQHESILYSSKDKRNIENVNFMRRKQNVDKILSKAKQLFSKIGKKILPESIEKFVKNLDYSEDILNRLKIEYNLQTVQKEFQTWLSMQDFSGGEKAYKLIDENGRVYRGVSMAWPGSKAPKEYFYDILHPTTKKPCPIPAKGWRLKRETMNELLQTDQIIFGENETTQPQRKYYLDEYQDENFPSVIYYGGDASIDLSPLGLEFPTAKPLFVCDQILQAILSKDDVIIDYFAGSGSAAHSIIRLNEKDSGIRKFILIEMADYFDTIMMPRVKKVAYSFDWKDGKPTATNGSGIFCKYLYLEQYEDALENIEFEQKKIEEFSDYFIKYMLDFETKGSNTFLNIERVEDPFNYKLKILETVGKPAKTVTIDLVETFNYLVGLEVEKIRVKKENGRKYVFIIGIVAGSGKTLVVWRALNNIDFEKDKEIIEKIRDEFKVDEVYINGDAAVKGFSQIESKFKALLWD